MARRKITVGDVGEVLEHWQAGRSIRAINRSLGVSRPTIHKYTAIAEAHGFWLSTLPRMAKGSGAVLAPVSPLRRDNWKTSRSKN